MPIISIRAKVFLLFSAAALITMLPVLVLIGKEVEERVYDRARTELQSAHQALQIFWAQKDETLVSTARSAANEPGVAELLQAGDTLTLQRTLRAGLTERLGIREEDAQ